MLRIKLTNFIDLLNIKKQRSETFKIYVKGNYEAQIHVYDELGNETIKRIGITVE